MGGVAVSDPHPGPSPARGRGAVAASVGWAVEAGIQWCLALGPAAQLKGPAYDSEFRAACLSVGFAGPSVLRHAQDAVRRVSPCPTGGSRVTRKWRESGASAAWLSL